MKNQDAIIEMIEEAHFSLLLHEKTGPRVKDDLISLTSHEGKRQALNSRISTCLDILTDDEAEANAIAQQCYEAAQQRFRRLEINN